MSGNIRHRFLHRTNRDVFLPRTTKDVSDFNNNAATTMTTVVPTTAPDVPEVKPEFHVVPRHRRIFGLPRRALYWLYSASLGILLLMLLGFSAVVPIDVIAKSKSNLALNTLVTLICCVIFIVVLLLLYSVRLFILRLNLQDIPKFYIPDHHNDMPLSCYNYIQQNIQKCREIMAKAKPNQIIKHPGLYHKSSNVEEVPIETLPDFVVYEDVIKGFGDFAKMRGLLFKDKSLQAPKHFCYPELIQYLEEREILILNHFHFDEFSHLYQRLRFSGVPIEESDFLKLMELFIKTADFFPTNHKVDTISPEVPMNDESLSTELLSVDASAKDPHRQSASLSNMITRSSSNNSVLLHPKYSGSDPDPFIATANGDYEAVTRSFDREYSDSRSYNVSAGHLQQTSSSNRGRRSFASTSGQGSLAEFDSNFMPSNSGKYLTTSSPVRPSAVSSSSLSSQRLNKNTSGRISSSDDDFYQSQNIRRFRGTTSSSSLRLEKTESNSSNASLSTTQHYPM